MLEKIALYPGTFDPITLGHIDVLERASRMFDKVIVVMAVNSKKKNLFSDEERALMAREALAHIPNVEVETYKGLIYRLAIEKKAVALIRGLRAVTDFEYEFQMALMNRKLDPEVTTIFLMPHEKYTYLNSSIIRELASYGEDVSEFVPAVVAAALREKFGG